ncbi:PREDICTED: double homeobox protein 4-like protein 4-like, partial [Odobenus rosmarus divergens]|uniref:Double homeobox protein 4-like protein 4-like n=1 Tax=Odobenus rosmarus divergens TaxID=9708 RepID=A0A9B0M5T5_ODORO
MVPVLPSRPASALEPKPPPMQIPTEAACSEADAVWGSAHIFQQNPYPGIATRERLARELDIPQSRIQVLFKNQRTTQLRQSQLGSAKSQGERQPQEGRRKRTSISPSQTSILLQAFEKNCFPSIATRDHMARLTGLLESRIQVWFQNRRARTQG